MYSLIMISREFHFDRFSSPTRRFFAMAYIMSTRSNIVILIAYILASALSNIQPTYQQQNLCPKVCNCEEQKLTVSCRGRIDVNGLPHTLNPSTRRLTINDGQTSQLSGLDNYQKLEFLDLAFNKLTFVDSEELSKDASLQNLNASHNQIGEIKDSLVFKTLISMRANNLATEDANADLMKTMKKLPKINILEINLSHNDLSSIKNLTFFRWHKLQRLDLSNNIISSLESESLYGLIKLEHLNLRGNRLKKIPSNGFQSTTRSPSQSIYTAQPLPPTSSNLQTIDLSENAIKSIEYDSFSMLDKLQEISLESCSIQKIHDNCFSNLHTLSALNLDQNNLIEVPSNSFSQLGVLRALKMNHNNIANIGPDSFRDLTNLEDLQLRNQSFEIIPTGAFKGLYSLRKLDLSSNMHLTKIEQGAFEGLIRLTYLNLSHSSLPYLLNDFMQETNILLDLRNNPLRCGCELRWLTKWIQNLNETLTQMKNKKNVLPIVHSHNAYTISNDILLYSFETIEQIMNLTCAGPTALVGRLVAKLPIKKLECLDPTSNLNVHIGFAILSLIMLVLVTVCTINFCRNKNYLLVMLKSNLAPSHISMMMPYKPNSRHEGHSYDMRKETQFIDNGDYEPVDYSQAVYTIGDNGAQFLYYGQRQT